MRRVGASSAVLGGLLLVALGGVGVALFGPPPQPRGSEQAAPPSSWPAEATVFADERVVQATPVMAPVARVLVERAGTVTALACTPGEALVAGSAPLHVDGAPVVALATQVPLWRDLAVGSTGEDVAALQRELQRLGHDVAVDGTYGQGTGAAVAELWRGLGVAKPSTALPRADVVWLPADELEVGECTLTLGEALAPGDALATGMPRVSALRFEAPAGAVPGERTMTFAGVTVPLDPGAGGSVTVSDPALLAAVAASPELALVTSGVVEGASLALSYALAAPLDLLAVPPAALADLNGAAGCLVIDGAGVGVEVVSSSLGLSLVSLPDGVAPPAEVGNPALVPGC